MAKSFRTVLDYPDYLAFIKSKSVRKFENKDQVEAYLEAEVFSKQGFINNIKDTAQAERISYRMAHTLLTTYLIDLLYEIDIAQEKTRKKTRIRIPEFMYFDIELAVFSRYSRSMFTKGLQFLFKKSPFYKLKNKRKL